MSASPFENTKVIAEVWEKDSLERLFSCSERLRVAMTHKSASPAENNERFEFLGDAVIELAVRWSLMRDNPEASEGELSRMKIDLVRKSTLARCADRLRLRESIVTGSDFGRGEIPDSVAADAYEAVAGALFADSGFEKAFQFVRDTLTDCEEATCSGDPKTLLQEYCQARKIPLPEYRTDLTAGPSHAPVFDISVIINGFVLGTGRASSKKISQEMAAAAALQTLEGEGVNGLHAE
ncbi:MAG: ribonuclease III [Candidatus Sabulitectum sp.]|nr:ribonuclease III [Candidatus Sabulitectum sp.]